MRFKRLFVILIVILNPACSLWTSQDGPPSTTIELADINNATPKYEPLSRGGNPDSYVVKGKRYRVLDSSKGYHERGIASWYGTKFHGNKTSNGEIYDMYAMTAAHKSLPLPTYVNVTNIDNGQHIIVRVNDRGPFIDNRIIDLSYAAALKLDMTRNGTANVEISAIDTGQGAKLTKKVTYNSTQTRSTYERNSTDLYIQIGAFKQRINAEKFLTNLNENEKLVKELKHTVKSPPKFRIIEAKTSIGNVYRVHLGPVKDPNYMQDIGKILSKLGFNDTFVHVE